MAEYESNLERSAKRTREFHEVVQDSKYDSSDPTYVERKRKAIEATADWFAESRPLEEAEKSAAEAVEFSEELYRGVNV